jgi:hypothetical protein
MKKLLIVFFGMLPTLAIAAGNNLCSAQSASKSFLSSWNDDDSPLQVLSTYAGSEFQTEEGRVVYKGDLNGDGNDDLIFEAYSSEGSSKEMVNEILIQCKGFLVNVGGDYYSKVEVGNTVAATGFKSIKAYTYLKNKVNGAPVDMKSQTSTVLNFNPATKRYE